MSPPDANGPSLAPFILIVVAFVTVPLAGCVGGSGDAGASLDDGGDAGDGAGGSPAGTNGSATAPLSFDTEPGVRTDNVTVTVEPQDACLPVACNSHMATGNAEFIKFIDISHLLPAGTHARVEAEATWDDGVPGPVFQEMNLQWWFQDMWVNGTETVQEPGRAWIGGHVSSHGPEPAQLILVVIEPENTQPIEVDVSLTVEPLVDRVAPGNPVAVELDGPTKIEATTDGSLQNGVLQVHGPDDALVTTAPFDGGNATARLPAGSPAGEYVLHVRGAGDPVSFHVPDANLSEPGMRLLDVSPDLGEERTPPDGRQEMTWTRELDRAPYWVSLWVEQLDRWAVTVNMNVTITGPQGTVVDGAITCLPCGYSIFVFGTAPGSPELTAGTYTFTVTADVNAEYTVREGIGTYR